MMAATGFLPASPRLPQRGISTNFRGGMLIKKGAVINAQQGESEGKSVDENMIVLRMRIKKMKVLESSGSSNNQGAGAAPPSSDWTEWERRVFTRYHEGVCDSVETLQAYLMNTRPSVALGMLALIAMSLPFSTSVVMVNALKVAKGLLAGCHMCIDIDF